MNYLLYGTQYPMIKKRLNRLLKERVKEVDDNNVSKLEYGKVEVDEIIDELEFCPLGVSRKVVVIDHAEFLAKPYDKKVSDSLLPYASVSADDIDIIFVLRNNNIDEKSPVFKALQNNGQIFYFQELSKSDWRKYVEKYFKERDFEIEEKAVNELVVRVNNDLSTFLNEAEKLILYKEDNHHISLLDITTLVSPPIEDNVFQMSNALFRGDNALALSIFRDLKLFGSKLVDSLIPMLASQFRFMFDVIYLNQCGLNRSQIAHELGASDIRVKMANINARGRSLNLIKDALIQLANIDYLSKCGKLDRLYAFELFLINF